ncbi:unnamed protein product [Brugia timori]|uniref:Uncharacterized protein n=1 Tax=Brugia timori TaxID=42155 RepID=A0A0R3Q716_9BILA|nr:unnamed protein product [Brugia timori]
MGHSGNQCSSGKLHECNQLLEFCIHLVKLYCSSKETNARFIKVTEDAEFNC